MGIDLQKKPDDSMGLSDQPLKDNNSNDASAGYTFSGPQVRPWVRYWARVIDLSLFSIFFGLGCAILCPTFLEVNDVFFGVIVTILYIFVEPFLLSTWGTTPGKALLNVRLRKNNGAKVSYEEGLLRSAKVCWRGLGLEIPIVSLLTHIAAYNTLSKTGITSWDKDGNTQITHQVIGGKRSIIAVLLFCGLILLMLIAAEM
jgi:uncharacterized RDD family membrane protein YckC